MQVSTHASNLMNPWDLSCRSKLGSSRASCCLSQPTHKPQQANAEAAKTTTTSDKLKVRSPSSSFKTTSSTSPHLRLHHLLSSFHSIPASSLSPATTSSTLYSSLDSSSPDSSSSSSSSSSSISINSNSSNQFNVNPTQHVPANKLDQSAADESRLDQEQFNISQSLLLSPSSTNLLDNCLTDRKARKKDQNRRAAYNYRRKKMEEKNRMREEEMRLVYSRVCLVGYADELENSIMYILKTDSKKILDREGNVICFFCPICLKSCDNTVKLRSHLNVSHYQNVNLC